MQAYKETNAFLVGRGVLPTINLASRVRRKLPRPSRIRPRARPPPTPVAAATGPAAAGPGRAAAPYPAAAAFLAGAPVQPRLANIIKIENAVAAIRERMDKEKAKAERAARREQEKARRRKS